MGWYTVYIRGLLSLSLMEFCQVENSLCMQVLRSPILAAWLHGTRAVGVSHTLRRGTRNGIAGLSLLVIFSRWRHLYSGAAITLGIGPHSSSFYWGTVCKTVCPMPSDRCHVCSVCDVGVLWPNGWMDQDATRYGGRPRPSPHCVRCGDPASPTAAPPHFSAHVYCGHTVAHLSYCWDLLQSLCRIQYVEYNRQS